MWTPTIALELRKRGLDVVAISEPACASRYAGVSDDAVFARAHEDRRTIVTDNVADFELARRDWESRGKPHYGIVYAIDPPFNRHRGERVIGQMVKALARLLSSRNSTPRPTTMSHTLRRIAGR
jgi:hypothetical protein